MAPANAAFRRSWLGRRLWPLPRRLARGLLLALLQPLLGLRIDGLEHLPADGPVIVAGNHLHNADPVLVAIASPRPLHYMAKRELFEVPIIGWLLRRGGSFPVDRGRADRAALRVAEERLARGVALGMFPEGTRSRTGRLQPARAGAGLLALRSGAVVVPVAITGTERLPFDGGKQRRTTDGARARAPIRLRFGPGFVVPSIGDGRPVRSREATSHIMAAIADLLPAAYRGGPDEPEDRR